MAFLAEDRRQKIDNPGSSRKKENPVNKIGETCQMEQIDRRHFSGEN